ncbi:hypothetical protein [Streptomyces genisteinicus]|uniref:Uncharacterized protein n=1 Tax=Streptomyces genisteinicus TaxID=2768068 RepID=A0A7H0HSH1_9ACTN|nr:hypothetical protein [Streptomyces genisteinicus]QNP63487.1 hypothetical protein IAG43_11470 [Streptomyces genisteinicus]
MLIEGYDPESDDPLVAGEDLLTLPGFWLCHLGVLCPSGTRPETFGADAADADAAFETVMDEDSWPVFRIPFGGGHTAVVLYRNFDDDAGVEFFVTHPEWAGRQGHLATIDGHPAGPGLAWPELRHIAHTPDAAAPGVQDPHARLLLLLPVLGDTDLPDDAAAQVAASLTATGTPAGEAPALASVLLAHNPFWSPAGWALPSASPLSGTTDAPWEGVLCCDGPLSPRNGLRIAQGINRAQHERLAAALGTSPAAP